MAGYPLAVLALLRTLRGERALMVSVAVLVLITSGLAAAVPRLYTRVLDAELARRVEDAGVYQRSISAILQQRYNNPNQEIRERLAGMGAAYQDALPSPLREALAESTYSIDAPDFLVADDLRGNQAAFARLLSVRYQRDVGAHVDLVEGRLPQLREDVTPPPSPALPESRADGPLPLLEVALSEQTAGLLELEVGDQMVGVFDDATTLFEQGPGSWFMVEVAGIFRAAEPSSAYWGGDQSFDLVSQRDASAIPFTSGRTEEPLALTGAALFAPEAYTEWARLTELADWSYTWRFQLDPSAVTAVSYAAVAAQTGNLDVTKGPYDAPGWPPGQLRVTTRIPLLFSGYEERTRFTVSVIALTALGVFGTAAATFALLSTLISERRRATAILLRGRGATRAQLIGARLVEGLLLCGSAAAAGYLGAVTLIDARDSLWSLWCAAGVALAMLTLLVGGAESARAADLGRLLRRTFDPLAERSTRRLTLEATLVVVAVAGLAALRQRGLSADANPDTSLDPLLIGAPLLLALVVGVLGRRLYPAVVGLLARLAQPSRGLVWFVGLRRGSDPSGGAFLPFLVMLAAVSISIFASVIAQSVTQAQEETAWRLVGADYRLEAEPFDPNATTLAPAAAPGGPVASHAVVAGALTANGSLIAADANGRFASRSSTMLSVVAIDVAAYRRVIGDRLAPFTLPSNASDASAQHGSEANPLPVILAADWSGDERPQPGTLLRVELRVPGSGTLQAFASVAGYSERYPGIERGRPFVLLSLADLRALAPERVTQVTTLFVQGTAQDVLELKATIGEQAIDGNAPVQVDSRAGAFDKLLHEPLTNAVVTSFRAGAGIAALYAGLALLFALTLTARRRAHDLSVLRTLGLPAGRAGAVIAVEYLPLIGLATVSGVALGIAIAFVIEPGVDLAAFTGATAAPPLAISWPAVAAIGLGLAALALATIAAYVLVIRRRQLGRILRVSD